MDIKELNEQLKPYVEAVGDTLRQHHTLQGNPWVEEDAGICTFEFMGFPIEYQMSRFVETDKDNGEIVRDEYRLEPTEAGREIIERQLANKIEEEFKKQLKDNYNINVTRIGGTTLVGIPNAAKFEK